jgi:hypothetical protein
MTDSCGCSPEAGSATCDELRVLSREATACPTNGRIGKAIDTQTVKSMLALPLTELHSGQYYFCKESGCPTVYYNMDGQTFIESNLRERVYQKNPADDTVKVCYCFQHTPESIREELDLSGKTTVVASITDGIQLEQCACHIRNPQGSCCLGNVNVLVKRIEKEPSIKN